MSLPRLHPQYGMKPPKFPVYNRNTIRLDVHFAENPELDGNNFWVGEVEVKEIPIKAQLPVKSKKKQKLIAPIQTPVLVVKKKKSKKSKKARKAKKLKAEKQQNQKVPTQPPNSGAKNLQQANPQGVKQTVNTEVKKEKPTTTQDGNMKRHEAYNEANDGAGPGQPYKKFKSPERELPVLPPGFMVNRGWQGDTSTMLSCKLCGYHTHEEYEIQKHFFSYQHKEILRHLYVFFPRETVDFLNDYLLFRKKKVNSGGKKSNPQPSKDSFKDIGPEHYLHRIQAAYCQACDFVIPDVPEFLTHHISTDLHLMNCKTTLRRIKIKSVEAAKELLEDNDVLQLLTIYNMGQNPFKDPTVCWVQGNTQEVFVAEEDDDAEEKAALAYARAAQEKMKPDLTATSSMTVNTDGKVMEEEDEAAAEAP